MLKQIMESPASSSPATIMMPNAAAMSINAKTATIITADGEMKTTPLDHAGQHIQNKPVIVCHAPYIKSKLNDVPFIAFDILELFAFIHPTKFCVPTPVGIAKALGLQSPNTFEDTAMTLIDCVQALLSDLQNDPYIAKAPADDIAAVMGLNGTGWVWTPFIFSALGKTYEKDIPLNHKKSLAIWKHLPEWVDEPPPPPPSHHGVTADEAEERLQKLLKSGNGISETRPEQTKFAQAIATIFDPPETQESPSIALAEAGTGTGKTLGYLAPASVWAEKNDGAVWISTYTKNLQAQIDSELDRLYPQAELKDAHVAIRKGRENYLCLLNFEDAAAGAALSRDPRHVVAAGILARWLAATKNGDINGSEFPGWLTGLLGYRNTLALADRRGECIYSACDHYKNCFVEHSQRSSKRARLVVANHALVMIQAAMSAPGDDMPSRYIFDEGHHVFSAADSAFAAHLTARETQDLRRWILGAEGGGRQSRARGLKKRCDDLVTGDPECEALLGDIIEAARFLTSVGWSKRLKDGNPRQAAETFIHAVYHQVKARSNDAHTLYSLETETYPVDDSVVEQANALQDKIKRLQAPMKALAEAFRKKLNDDQGTLESDTRNRLDNIAASLERRALMGLQAWIDMLAGLNRGETPPDYVDWMAIERNNGQSVDVGLYRHHLNPAKPFAASMRPHAHGIGISSATLLDNADETYQDWEKVARLTGMIHLNQNAETALLRSPFDYAKQTRVYILDDVNKRDAGQVAGAYRALFTASGGGALGLFTAISRLRTIYDHIAVPLEEKDIALYAQHVDDIDTGTLVDMFRDDVDACLLGTDAVRDGVDIPGKSLRLIAFDRVPWPRPDILHKARRKAFGGKTYDEMLTRLKLKQAFGRLIRKADDKGIFVMLDSGFPSRLHNAFPPDVEIVKCGLSEAVKSIQEFLNK